MTLESAIAEAVAQAIADAVPRLAAAAPAEYLTYAEAAKRCRCSVRTLRQEAADGRLRVCYVKGMPRLATTDLEAYLRRPRPAGCDLDDAAWLARQRARR